MYDTFTPAERRSAFSDGDLDTASPSRILIKCFDRLDADLERALASIEGNDHETTNRELGHAQDLLGEMAAMVDVDVWQHAGALLSVYDYVLRLLMVASMRKVAPPVVEARVLLHEIGDGFRVAADQLDHERGAAPAARPAPTFAAAAADRLQSFSVLA